MKKLLLILAIAITFLSCSTNSVTDDDLCNCQKETWLRYNGGEWYTNGAKTFYSNDCTDNGDVIAGHSGQGYDFQYRINCE
jgi:hypothetical protein